MLAASALLQMDSLTATAAIRCLVLRLEIRSLFILIELRQILNAGLLRLEMLCAGDADRRPGWSPLER